MSSGKNSSNKPGIESVDGARAPAHNSDDPGREYKQPDAGAKAFRSSGPGSPSIPRHPGMGERQAPRSECETTLTDRDPLVPGEVLYGSGDLEINAGIEVTTLRVTNTGDRPIQIGSHYHFAEVNAALDFDRDAAWGKRLNVLSGGSVRFEPGATQQVELVSIGGQRIVRGLRGLCGGSLDG